MWESPASAVGRKSTGERVPAHEIRMTQTTDTDTSTDQTGPERHIVFLEERLRGATKTIAAQLRAFAADIDRIADLDDIADIPAAVAHKLAWGYANLSTETPAMLLGQLLREERRAAQENTGADNG